MEVHSMRLDHGPIQTNNMSYPQRQPQNHRPNHSQAHAAVAAAAAELYKPSRSPLPPMGQARCPPTFPVSPHMQQGSPNNLGQVQVSQRYTPQGQAPSMQQPPHSQPSPLQPNPQPPATLLTSYHHRPTIDYRHQNRISLLHPEYGQGRHRDGGMPGMPGGSAQNIPQRGMQNEVVYLDGPGGGQQPLKKIRLTDKEGVQPLRIDTRPGPYNPQVEAISPTLPEPVSQEDQDFKTTKDELIQKIGRVDREIAKAESQIAFLKKKQAELEEIANKPAVKAEPKEDEPKHQSLPQKIYAENRKRAAAAHAQLESLGPKVEWPLYNQPSDTSVYRENKNKNVLFKKKLLEYFKARHSEEKARKLALCSSYNKLMQEWLRKVDKIESSTKRKGKDAKNREFFEKVFPELKKQREDKERFNRVGARVKSEADMEEIMDNLQEQAMEDKKMRSYAVIPPILRDPKERRIMYRNNNGYVEDMEAVYKSRQFLNIWTPTEQETFKEKYLLHPKNFGVIASYLDRKSVSDCVQYYYLSKKTEQYKQLLRKNRRERLRERLRGARNPNKVNSNANACVVDTMTTGVTTRLQREQQQKTGSTRTNVNSVNNVVDQNMPASNVNTTSDNTSVNNSTPPPAMPAAASAASPLVTAGTTVTTSGSSTLGSSSVTSSGLTDFNSTTTGQIPCVSTAAPSIGATQNPSQTLNSVISTSSAATTIPSSGSAATSIASTPISSSLLKDANLTNSSASVSTVVQPMDTSVQDSKKFTDFNSFEDYNNRKFLSSGGQNDNSASQQQQLLSEISKDAGGDKSTTLQQVPDNSGNLVPVPSGLTVTVKKEEDSGISDHNASLGPLTENKKKKERRKDKENTNADSSDDDVNMDKAVIGTCAVCQSQLGPQLHSRPLAPSQAVQYGLREEQVTPNSRVCNICRCKVVRSRNTHCPLPNCPNSKGRVKRLRSFPYRLQELPSDVREPILQEFRIPSGVTKCCSACFNRIQRRLGPVEDWPEEEIQQLKNALTELGANWQLVAERLNKVAPQVRSFYASNRKRLNLESCLGDRKPALTDEEESGSSTSSCEEQPTREPPLRDRERERHSSDTTSATSATGDSPSQSTSQNPAKKEDYDSSATETADEANTPDHYQTTITPVANEYQQVPGSTPLSEIVMNVIERSLNQHSSNQPNQQNIPPTISSILSTDANEVTIVSEYNLNPNRNSAPVTTRPDLSKIAGTIGATITPVTGPLHSQNPPEPISSSRDDLVVVQVPDNRESIPETLDLSIKKPREPPPIKIPQAQIHRSEPYIYHQERKSPAAFIRTKAQVKLPSPQPANPNSGSITLGTPIINPPRYDGLLRQIPEPKMGSITKGTPIQHIPHSVQQDKRALYEAYYAKQTPTMPPQQPPSRAPQPQYQYRQPVYEPPQMSSQMSSRQIIMNDYITSQQMLGRRQEKPPPQSAYYPTNSPHRTPPPPQQNQQQRQGVIQRHTRPQYLPPGHEALSSLVDVAVQQPSLPVPTQPHEGLGKTMADNIMEQPHRFQLQMQQQLRQQQQRIEEQRRVERAYHQQQQAARAQAGRSGDPSTMTAASLIDAIITHQINQTEGNREIQPNTREPPRTGADLLFQSFHREQPNQQREREDPSDRQGKVINVDLEPENVTKTLTVKELTDSVISHDFGKRPGAYYHLQENMNEQWKRRLQAQQAQKEEQKRAQTSQQPPHDERQIIRIAQPQQKYHVEPVSPPESNHWSEQNYRRYPQPQSHMSPLDYVKNRIVEVMRTEDDKKDMSDGHAQDKDRSDSPGEMVIDEGKPDNDFPNQHGQNVPHSQPNQSTGYPYYSHKENLVNEARNNEPKPLLSAQYEPLSDED